MTVSFGEQFKKSHENLKKIIFFVPFFQILIKQIFSYCSTGLGAITASFVEHFKENQENTTCRLLCGGNISGINNIAWQANTAW